MKYQISQNPVGIVEFDLDDGDIVTAESGSMVYSKGDIRLETKKRRGGLLKTLKTAALGGESFFINEFITGPQGANLGLSGPVLGDIAEISIDKEYLVQSGAYVCSTGDLTLDTQWQGFTKGMFGTNLFMLKTVGEGIMFVNALGGIIKGTLEVGEKMSVDNYQLVAFPSTCNYIVKKHGNLKTTIFGGETLVVEIEGPGDIYMQTKNAMEFARFIYSFMPKPRR